RDVRGQRRGQVGNQQEGRQLADRLTGIVQGGDIEARRRGGEQQMAGEYHGDLQQRDQAAQGERAQDDGQQVQVQQRAGILAAEPQRTGDEYHHGPGLDHQSSAGTPGKEPARAECDDGQRERSEQPGHRPGLGDQRPRPDQHQGGKRQTENPYGSGAAHGYGRRTAALTDPPPVDVFNS